MADLPEGRPILHAAMTSVDYAGLESRIGYVFSNRDLLVRALTHASIVGVSGKPPLGQTYERLEFLGDRVLGLVIADMLMAAFPDESEGDLSRRLARLVNAETCTRVATDLHLDDYIRTADGLDRIGRRAANGIRADVCEALIGAVYRDAGFSSAAAVVEKLWQVRIQSMSGPMRDAKTELQEWAHKRGLKTPRYEVASVSGPDHDPDFVVSVVIDQIAGEQGSGKSKREAEQAAARAILEREQIWPVNDNR